MRAGLTQGVRASAREREGAEESARIINKRLGDAARVTKEAIKEDFLLPDGEGSEGAGSE